MTETCISHLCCGFAHVITARAQQLSRAFHPQIAQILGYGKANFARKNPAKIKWAATNFLAEEFERWRICEITLQQLLGSFDPFTRNPLFPHAEHLLLLRRTD